MSPPRSQLPKVSLPRDEKKSGADLSMDLSSDDSLAEVPLQNRASIALSTEPLPEQKQNRFQIVMMFKGRSIKVLFQKEKIDGEAQWIIPASSITFKLFNIPAQVLKDANFIKKDLIFFGKNDSYYLTDKDLYRFLYLIITRSEEVPGRKQKPIQQHEVNLALELMQKCFKRKNIPSSDDKRKKNPKQIADDYEDRWAPEIINQTVEKIFRLADPSKPVAPSMQSSPLSFSSPGKHDQSEAVSSYSSEGTARKPKRKRQLLDSRSDGSLAAAVPSYMINVPEVSSSTSTLKVRKTVPLPQPESSSVPKDSDKAPSVSMPLSTEPVTEQKKNFVKITFKLQGKPIKVFSKERTLAAAPASSSASTQVTVSPNPQSTQVGPSSSPRTPLPLPFPYGEDQAMDLGPDDSSMQSEQDSTPAWPSIDSIEADDKEASSPNATELISDPETHSYVIDLKVTDRPSIKVGLKEVRLDGKVQWVITESPIINELFGLHVPENSFIKEKDSIFESGLLYNESRYLKVITAKELYQFLWRVVNKQQLLYSVVTKQQARLEVEDWQVGLALKLIQEWYARKKDASLDDRDKSPAEIADDFQDVWSIGISTQTAERRVEFIKTNDPAITEIWKRQIAFFSDDLPMAANDDKEADLSKRPRRHIAKPKPHASASRSSAVNQDGSENKGAPLESIAANALMALSASVRRDDLMATVEKKNFFKIVLKFNREFIKVLFQEQLEDDRKQWVISASSILRLFKVGIIELRETNVIKKRKLIVFEESNQGSKPLHILTDKDFYKILLLITKRKLPGRRMPFEDSEMELAQKLMKEWFKRKNITSSDDKSEKTPEQIADDYEWAPEIINQTADKFFDLTDATKVPSRAIASPIEEFESTSDSQMRLTPTGAKHSMPVTYADDKSTSPLPLRFIEINENGQLIWAAISVDFIKYIKCIEKGLPNATTIMTHARNYYCDIKGLNRTDFQIPGKIRDRSVSQIPLTPQYIYIIIFYYIHKYHNNPDYTELVQNAHAVLKQLFELTVKEDVPDLLQSLYLYQDKLKSNFKEIKLVLPHRKAHVVNRRSRKAPQPKPMPLPRPDADFIIELSVAEESIPEGSIAEGSVAEEVEVPRSDSEAKKKPDDTYIELPIEFTDVNKITYLGVKYINGKGSVILSDLWNIVSSETLLRGKGFYPRIHKFFTSHGINIEGGIKLECRWWEKKGKSSFKAHSAITIESVFALLNNLEKSDLKKSVKNIKKIRDQLFDETGRFRAEVLRDALKPIILPECISGKNCVSKKTATAPASLADLSETRSSGINVKQEPDLRVPNAETMRRMEHGHASMDTSDANLEASIQALWGPESTAENKEPVPSSSSTGPISKTNVFVTDLIVTGRPSIKVGFKEAKIHGKVQWVVTESCIINALFGLRELVEIKKLTKGSHRVFFESGLLVNGSRLYLKVLTANHLYQFLFLVATKKLASKIEDWQAELAIRLIQEWFTKREDALPNDKGKTSAEMVYDYDPVWAPGIMNQTAEKRVEFIKTNNLTFMSIWKKQIRQDLIDRDVFSEGSSSSSGVNPGASPPSSIEADFFEEQDDYMSDEGQSSLSARELEDEPEDEKELPFLSLPRGMDMDSDDQSKEGEPEGLHTSHPKVETADKDPLESISLSAESDSQQKKNSKVVLRIQGKSIEVFFQKEKIEGQEQWVMAATRILQLFKLNIVSILTNKVIKRRELIVIKTSAAVGHSKKNIFTDRDFYKILYIIVNEKKIPGREGVFNGFEIKLAQELMQRMFKRKNISPTDDKSNKTPAQIADDYEWSPELFNQSVVKNASVVATHTTLADLPEEFSSEDHPMELPTSPSNTGSLSPLWEDNEPNSDMLEEPPLPSYFSLPEPEPQPDEKKSACSEAPCILRFKYDDEPSKEPYVVFRHENNQWVACAPHIFICLGDKQRGNSKIQNAINYYKKNIHKFKANDIFFAKEKFGDVEPFSIQKGETAFLTPKQLFIILAYEADIFDVDKSNPRDPNKIETIRALLKQLFKGLENDPKDKLDAFKKCFPPEMVDIKAIVATLRLPHFHKLKSQNRKNKPKIKATAKNKNKTKTKSTPIVSETVAVPQKESSSSASSFQTSLPPVPNAFAASSSSSMPQASEQTAFGVAPDASLLPPMPVRVKEELGLPGSSPSDDFAEPMPPAPSPSDDFAEPMPPAPASPTPMAPFSFEPLRPGEQVNFDQEPHTGFDAETDISAINPVSDAARGNPPLYDPFGFLNRNSFFGGGAPATSNLPGEIGQQTDLSHSSMAGSVSQTRKRKSIGFFDQPSSPSLDQTATDDVTHSPKRQRIE